MSTSRIIRRFASENYVANSVETVVNGDTPVAQADNATNAVNAENAVNATNAKVATKATQDADGNVIASTYETKADASAKLTEAKNFATQIKNDLLNGAGEAYDTLKELGDLINEKQDAITALETVASSKADKSELFSKSYNDLTDKPNIPSIEGLATTEYVDSRVDELFQNVSNGKKLIASAIADKGVYASDDETFQGLSDKIGLIPVGAPGTNIIGYINEENDIYVSLTELESGTYTLKFEDYTGLLEEFDDIGTVEVE